MAKMQQNWGAFVLQLLGSIVFLYIVFGWNGGLSTSAATTGVFSGTGGFWAPIFVGAAAVASIALFFASFSHINGMEGPRLNMMGLETAAVAGVTLMALTWGTFGEWATIFGVVMGFLGPWLSAKM